MISGFQIISSFLLYVCEQALPLFVSEYYVMLLATFFYNLLVSNESVCSLYRCNPVRLMLTPFIILYFYSHFLSQMLKREHKSPVKVSHIFISSKR
jgi:hypothetical protein